MSNSLRSLQAEADSSGESRDKYRPIARLGSGGMADVFLAQAGGMSGFSKLAVIKRPRDARAGDEDMQQMFLDEARLAARLNHPNVVNTFEVGTDTDGLFIAMEFLDGQPLSRITRQLEKKGSEFPLPLRLQVLRDVLTALEYAHDLCDYDRSPLAIVHRDVSPQNVFVLYSGQAKLVDFGIAKAASRMSETRTGVLKGKLAYMAPEQARSEDIDARCDLFSVGVMLWESLTRRRLWSGFSDVNVLKTLVAGTPMPSPLTFDSDLPQALVDVCMKALDVDRDQRYATAAEFLSALEVAITATGLGASSRDVGRFVEQWFGEDRGRVTAQIEAFISRDAEGATSLLDLSATIGPTDSNSSEKSGSGSGSSPSAIARRAELAQVSAGTPPTHSGEVSVRRPAKKKWMLAAIIAALAGASATASYLIWRDARGPETAIAPLASVAPPRASNVVAAPVTPTADPVDRVRVELVAAPPEAKIVLDGAEVSNPYRAELVKDNQSHTVRVSASGYNTKVMQVSLVRDISSDIALSPVTVFAVVPAHVAKPVAKAPTPPPTPKPDPRPTVAATAAATTPPKPAGPGDVLQGPSKKPTVVLDPTSPY